MSYNRVTDNTELQITITYECINEKITYDVLMAVVFYRNCLDGNCLDTEGHFKVRHFLLRLLGDLLQLKHNFLG